MGRKNRNNRHQQRVKHHIEDKMARRAIKRACEDSYRTGDAVTIHPDGRRVLTFTDPSFEVMA